MMCVWWTCVDNVALVIWEYVDMFFFKQKTAYEMRISDWSSDVCSSDLLAGEADPVAAATGFQPQEEGERTMAYTRYKGDPYWKRAKVGGTSADGTPYAKGDRVFFYPRSGATYAGDAASRASAEFDELASLEG